MKLKLFLVVKLKYEIEYHHQRISGTCHVPYTAYVNMFIYTAYPLPTLTEILLKLQHLSLRQNLLKSFKVPNTTAFGIYIGPI